MTQRVHPQAAVAGRPGRFAHCRKGILLLLFGALVLGSGCSWFGNNDSDKPKKEKLKPTKLERFDREVRLRREWRAKIGSGLGRKHLKLRPAVVADRVIAADAFGSVAAFDRFSGKRQWQARIGRPDKPGFVRGLWDRRDSGFVSGGVGAGGGMVFLGTTTGEVVALNVSDGEEAWRIDVNTEVVAPPVYDDERLFIQTIDGRLMARRADSGESIWTFDSQVPILTLRGTSTPVLSGGVVYTGFANGMLVALKAQDGEPLWQHRVMLPQGRSELDRMVDVDASPLIDGPLIYAVSFNGRLKALRAADGRPLWEYETSSYLDIDTGYGHVYVIDEDDRLEAIDAESAEQAWAQPGLVRRTLTGAVAYNNYVLVGDAEGFLHVIAQSDGRFLGRQRLDGDGLRSNLVVADDLVYVYGNSGTLTALSVDVLDDG